MSVIIRCPNCGTTRAALGECEACGEAEVRYFCTNHLPGVWLDSRMCRTCGARYGEPVGRVSTPSARAHPSAPARAPTALPAAAHSSASVSTTRPGRPELDSAELAPWQKILAAALRARYLASSAAAERERRITAPSAGGCLRRLLLIVALLFVAFLIATFFFGRALLHGLQSY